MRKVRGMGKLNGLSIICMAASAAILFSATIASADYSAWQYSKMFYFNTTSTGANITSDVSNFPVLVRLTSANFGGGFSQCLANGADIRFDQNGNAISFEIEQWNASGQAAAIWVKVPIVYGNNGSQYITMHWGKSGVSSESNSVAVFQTSNGYASDYHFKETSGSFSDATSNGYTGTRNGSMAAISAVIDHGQTLNGTYDYASMGNVLNPGTSNMTISAWVKRGETSSINTIIAKSNGGGPSSSYGWLFTFNANNSVAMFIANGGTNWGDAGSFAIGSTTQITDLTTWHYVVAVINKSSSSSCKIYIDGVDQTSTPTGNVTTVGSLSNSVDFRIGSEADGDCKFKGGLDEVCVATSARSSDWIKLSYENQKQNQTLVNDQMMSTLVLTNDGRGLTRVLNGATQGFGTLNVTISAEAYPGFQFVRWNVYGNRDSVTFGDATQATTTVIVKSVAVTVMAIFEDINGGATGGGVSYPNNCGPGDNMIVDGSVTVATTNTDKTLETMTVNGRIKCDGLKIENWLFSQKAPPDYVFGKSYNLIDLDKVEKFIKENGHLPEIPSAAEMQKRGLDITEFNMMLLKKVEELTLYTIQMKKEIEALKGRK